MQEAHLDLDQVDEAQRQLAAKGWDLVLGQPAGKEYLVVTMVRRGSMYVRNMPLSDLPANFEGRAQHVVCQWGKGRALQVLNLYGYPGKRELETNSGLIAWAAEWLSGCGRVPCLLAGDLNCELRDTGMDAALHMAGWWDVLRVAGYKVIPSHGKPSRLDHVLANREARGWVLRGDLLWHLGITTHAALWLQLRPHPVEKAPMRAPVPRLDGPACQQWTSAQQQHAERHLREKHEDVFLQAQTRGDIETMWAAWDEAATEWLACRAGNQPEGRRPYAHVRWQTDIAPATGRDGEATDAGADAALLELRRLEQLAGYSRRRQLHLPAAKAIWTALRKGGHQMARRHPEHEVPNETALDEWIHEARRQYQDKAAQLRTRRREAWREWVRSAMSNGGAKLYRWIRGGAQQFDTMIPQEQPEAGIGTLRWLNSLVGGPWQQYLFTSEPWRQIWQAPDPPQSSSRWEAALSNLPAFPERTPWTLERIQSLLRRLQRSKAPGLDGWRAGELRLLPSWLHSWLAAIFEQVELGGEWPEQLRRPEGVLLPKPGEAPPGHPGLHRRPIWLLPMAYRLWAAGRAKDFAAWQQQWPGARAAKGAEQAAWELAVAAAAAHAEGSTLGGIAVDWAKAYDRVALTHIEQAFGLVGMPEWIALPLLGAYTAPRRLRISGVLGPEWEPTSGLLPGCAIAVFILGLLTHPLQVALEESQRQHGGSSALLR